MPGYGHSARARIFGPEAHAIGALAIYTGGPLSRAGKGWGGGRLNRVGTSFTEVDVLKEGFAGEALDFVRNRTSLRGLPLRLHSLGATVSGDGSSKEDADCPACPA